MKKEKKYKSKNRKKKYNSKNRKKKRGFNLRTKVKEKKKIPTD